MPNCDGVLRMCSAGEEKREEGQTNHVSVMGSGDGLQNSFEGTECFGNRLCNIEHESGAPSSCARPASLHI